MAQDTDRLMAFLQAVAECEPCDHVPRIEGVDAETRVELLSHAGRMGWINLRTFMGDGTLPSGEVLKLTGSGRAALREAIQRQDSETAEADELSVADRRERRARVMKAVYELTGASTAKIVGRGELAGRLKWDESAVKPVVRYLVDKRLLRYETWGGFSLTAAGVDEVEEAMDPQSAGTEHLAGLRITTGDVSGGVIQVVHGRGGPAEQSVSPHERRGFWKWLGDSTWTVVLGAAGILLAGAITAIIATSGGTGTSNSGSGPGAVNAPSRSGGTSAALRGKAVTEYADNRSGSPVFASPELKGVRGVPARIPYGTRVAVLCQAPNQVPSVTSVTALYLIASGRWRGDYVVADTMSNGGPPGNTDTPNVDSRVPPCH